MPIHPLAFGGAWLTEHGDAHVVLAQVAPATTQILGTGATRPWVIATAVDLLGPKRHLGQIVTGNKPAILIFPELALGFDDWPAVDALVRGWPHPLIVIAGFGFTKGDRLTTWLGEAGPTARHPAWPADSGPAHNRVYNGGWCWVHRPEGTSCVTFLKTTAEQHEEIHIEGLDQGQFNLAMRLDDLIIFPVICSDFLSVSAGQRVIQRKIARYLEDEANDNTRVLIAGLLLQKAPNDKWRSAVLDIARGINSDRVNLCLVNGAHDMLAMEEDVDRWRDYSGAYIAKGRQPHLMHFSGVRRFTNEQIDGAVVRTTSPAVLGGPLRWSFSDATGRHLWSVHKDYGISQAGELIESPCSDRFRFETLRLLKRLSMALDAPPPSRTILARASYGTVEAQIKLETPPAAEILCQKLLFGEPSREAREHLTADTLSDFVPQSTSGLKVLGALKSAQHMAWQRDAQQKGQLLVQDRNINVLVWSYPGSPIRMRQTLQRWRSELADSNPLLVFKKATGTGYPAPHKSSERRLDVGEAPPPRHRSADEPIRLAQIVELDLDEIENCFDTEAADVFAAALNARVVAGVEKLAGAVHAG